MGKDVQEGVVDNPLVNVSGVDNPLVNVSGVDVPDVDVSRLASLLDARLEDIDAAVSGTWATPVVWRQPTHTCYVPAGVFSPSAPQEWAAIALGSLELFAQTGSEDTEDTPRSAAASDKTSAASSTGGEGSTGGEDAEDAALAGAARVAALLGASAADADALARLTVAKLRTEPIEDLRIDFEDGFTQRGIPLDQRDADEDARALSSAQVLAEWFTQRFSTNSMHEAPSSCAPVSPDSTHTPVPPFAGIRFKSFDPTVRNRGLRTLVIILTELNNRGVLRELYDSASRNYDPRALRLTFPKVQHHAQVEALVEVLSELEQQWGLAQIGAKIRFEVQVETPQSIVGPHGESEAAKIIAAADGRCLSLHYGTYDYSASMGVDAAHQSMEHPVADHAKDMLQVATAAVGVELSDGSTNRIPVGNKESILAGWELHHRLVTRHLNRGIRQGWDLHGNQLVTRHMATIAYFRANWQETAQRLKAYLAGDTSRWLDEPATAKAMAGYLRRAHACGAITDQELETAGATEKQLARLQVKGRM